MLFWQLSTVLWVWFVLQKVVMEWTLRHFYPSPVSEQGIHVQKSLRPRSSRYLRLGDIRYFGAGNWWRLSFPLNVLVWSKELPVAFKYTRDQVTLPQEQTLGWVTLQHFSRWLLPVVLLNQYILFSIGIQSYITLKYDSLRRLVSAWYKPSLGPFS